MREGQMRVLVKKLHHDAVLPTRATEGSVGFDLALIEDVEVSWHKLVVAKTGIAFELPFEWEGQIRLRSSIGKLEIIIPNAPGTIDWDYRGEIGILLIGLAAHKIHLQKGQKIAQVVFGPVHIPELLDVGDEELHPTERGSEGFGSSGK